MRSTQKLSIFNYLLESFVVSRDLITSNTTLVFLFLLSVQLRCVFNFSLRVSASLELYGRDFHNLLWVMMISWEDLLNAYRNSSHQNASSQLFQPAGAQLASQGTGKVTCWVDQQRELRQPVLLPSLANSWLWAVCLVRIVSVHGPKPLFSSQEQ